MSKAPSTLEIALRAKPHHIHAVATAAGIHADEIEAFGSHKAKVSLQILERLHNRPSGKLICVSGMTPTKEGDGKTCTSIALTQAMGLLKKKVMLCLREPSLAPIFGFKGGGTGGGYAQVLPMEDINLHFTGDIHAIQAAHNLLAAVMENHLHHGNVLDIDPEKILWRRTMDISDRQLRDVVVGVSKSSRFAKHRTGFNITAASEVMAALGLATSIHGFKNKLAKISVALNKSGELVTAKDLNAAGAMALLLKDTLKPNLVQTLEGQPVFMHTGPFANVSHGNNSLISTTLALKLANYVVTESGFGTDLGLEKMFDIVCREGDLKPSVVVLVVSIKALKSHAGEAMGSRKLSEALREGFENMDRHIENITKFGLPMVVAINRFPQDTPDEIKAVRDYLQSENIDCAVSEGVRLGGEGALELAEKVMKALTERPAQFKFFYPADISTEDKVQRLATGLYGAGGVTYLEEAKEDLEMIHRLKLDTLPVCVAKTPYSFSDDPNVKGAPTGWKLKVRRVHPRTGAGFLVVVAGKIMLMPGFPERPVLEEMDLAESGEPRGMF